MNNNKIMDIVFVVLHYIGIDDTNKCVESIKNKIDTNNFRIVVVDNCSPNNTFGELCLKYKEDIYVEVIKTEENLGFSKGNNYGLSYAQERYNAKFWVLSNNDVLLIQTNLIHNLEKEYMKSNFSVLGPMILSTNGRCDFNPVRTCPWTQDEIDHYIKGKKITLFLNYFGLVSLFEKFRRMKNKDKQCYKNFYERQEDVELFGCFLVLSNKYFERFKGLDNRTFLFAEEDILYTHAMNNGMKMVYLPEIAVFHNEDSSINTLTKTKRKKIKFMCKYIIESMEILKSIIHEYEMRK